MDNETYLKPNLPGEPVSIDRILKAVGDARRGDIILAPTYQKDRTSHTRWRIQREYPASDFKVKTERINQDEYQLRIMIL